MRKLFARIHRRFWIRRAVKILARHPICWSGPSATAYGAALYHLYLEEGFSAAEAIECDRQYWEG